MSVVHIVRDSIPAQLRDLANRVCAEDPSPALLSAVLAADGWTFNRDRQRYEKSEGVGVYKICWAGDLPNPLRNRDDAAAMMPAGYMIRVGNRSPESFYAMGFCGGDVIDAAAPTEPRARTAAALRVMAAMMEDGE